MTALRVLLLLLLMSSSTWAQGPGMFPWWDGPIIKDLGLSEEQTRQIRATVDESRDRMIMLREAVMIAELELKSEMDKTQVDARKAGESIEKVVAARAALTRAVSQMSLKLRMTLTASQWQELQRRQPRPGGPPPFSSPGRGNGPPRYGGPGNEPPPHGGPRRPPPEPPDRF
ncbi:MAG TPA: periplasmic heavy metal sensor [Acidobacteriota bacterium]|jgi:Spy/CpxP family protein refolding chaperone|nr:periplasmic heavy metal sensor [Acidobacteriota bacterium]